MYEIKMQSEIIGQVANNFMNEAQEIENMVSRINGYAAGLDSNWVGDSKNAFLQELNENTVSKLSAYVDHFAKLGNSLSQIVEMFQETDESC
ncbi:MAG: WXG100 family type VII secretion target [Clostridium sp.]|nr:WXG100 family type VII secretion target [Clostridium sp.]